MTSLWSSAKGKGGAADAVPWLAEKLPHHDSPHRRRRRPGTQSDPDPNSSFKNSRTKTGSGWKLGKHNCVL